MTRDQAIKALMSEILAMTLLHRSDPAAPVISRDRIAFWSTLLDTIVRETKLIAELMREIQSVDDLASLPPAGSRTKTMLAKLDAPDDENAPSEPPTG